MDHTYLSSKAVTEKSNHSVRLSEETYTDVSQDKALYTAFLRQMLEDALMTDASISVAASSTRGYLKKSRDEARNWFFSATCSSDRNIIIGDYLGYSNVSECVERCRSIINSGKTFSQIRKEFKF